MAKDASDQEVLENGGGLQRPDLACFISTSDEYSSENANWEVVRSSGSLICVEANCDDGDSVWFANAADFAGEHYFEQEIAAVKKAVENMASEGMTPKLFRSK